MSGSTDPARDSSLRDRKAPGVCIRQTPQPRFANVMAESAVDHPKTSIRRSGAQIAACVGLARREGGKERIDIVNWQFMFALNCDHI